MAQSAIIQLCIPFHFCSVLSFVSTFSFMPRAENHDAIDKTVLPPHIHIYHSLTHVLRSRDLPFISSALE
jgi:hypothetical protein